MCTYRSIYIAVDSHYRKLNMTMRVKNHRDSSPELGTILLTRQMVKSPVSLLYWKWCRFEKARWVSSVFLGIPVSIHVNKYMCDALIKKKSLFSHCLSIIIWLGLSMELYMSSIKRVPSGSHRSTCAIYLMYLLVMTML